MPQSLTPTELQRLRFHLWLAHRDQDRQPFQLRSEEGIDTVILGWDKPIPASELLPPWPLESKLPDDVRRLDCGCVTIPPTFQRAVRVCTRLNILLETLAVYNSQRDIEAARRTCRTIENHLQILRKE